MLLDDFLEQAEWTRLVVIVTSSYGAGQAPLGGHRFRELCNALVKQPREGMLKGISFALLGLGDSKYMTYLRNPTQVDEALQLAGATRVGIFGKANASGDQRAVISQWMESGPRWRQLSKPHLPRKNGLQTYKVIQFDCVENWVPTSCRKQNQTPERHAGIY
jgi:sulfite reductase alpha subunit-like flavoprotein